MPYTGPSSARINYSGLPSLDCYCIYHNTLHSVCMCDISVYHVHVKKQSDLSRRLTTTLKTA
eukprot:37038-Eustigmatos_ZCMA.PRE.1